MLVAKRRHLTKHCKLVAKIIKMELKSEAEPIKMYCRNPGLNRGHLDLQSNALPTELFRLLSMF
jgi:hypothetical protein